MDCEDADPCTRNETCNTALAVCEWDMLDTDGDGHVPMSCGGDDPDDSNDAVYPGAREICDGEDNDVDGEVDEEPDASDYCGGEACDAGRCPGCTSEPDRAALDAMYMLAGGDFTLGQVIGVCQFLYGTSQTALDCVDDATPAITDECRPCLNIWRDCEVQCACGLSFGSPSCTMCMCDDGCVAEYEACASMPHPVQCN